MPEKSLGVGADCSADCPARVGGADGRALDKTLGEGPSDKKPLVIFCPVRGDGAGVGALGQRLSGT